MDNHRIEPAVPTMTKIADLPEFDMAEWLPDEAAVAEYLTVVMEENDPAALAKAIEQAGGTTSSLVPLKSHVLAASTPAQLLLGSWHGQACGPCQTFDDCDGQFRRAAAQLLAAQLVPQYAQTIRAVVLSATFIYELTGPAMTKAALARAGELDT